MEKKKARKNKKKKSISNTGNEKEECLNSEKNNNRIINGNQGVIIDENQGVIINENQGAAINGNQKTAEEIIETEAKQNDNEIKNETNLLEESNIVHSMLTNNYTDNNDNEKYSEIEQGTDGLKLHQEKDAYLEISNYIVSTKDDNGNALQEEKDSKEKNWNIEENSSRMIQETNLDENNSKLSLIKISDEAEDIKAFQIINNPGIEIETTDLERSNSSDVNDVREIHSIKNCNPEIINIETSRSDFLAHQNLNNSDDELANKDKNLDNIGTKVIDDTIERILEEVNTAIIQGSKIGIEANIEVSNFTVNSEDFDTESSKPTERTEQFESQEIEKRNEDIEESSKKEFETIAVGVSLPESGACIIGSQQEIITESQQEIITELQQDINKSLISSEDVKSVEDSAVLNEVVEAVLNKVIQEKLISPDNSIQKLSSSEIPKENSDRLDKTESVTITWQQDSAKESQAVENLSGNESKVSYDTKLLRDSEESKNDEVAQSKNKFYEVITGFWKHTGFIKKRVETTMSSEQPHNLSSELNQMSMTRPGEISLASAESSSKLIKSFEDFTESSTIVAAPDSETNIILSSPENTAIIYPKKNLFEDQTSQNSLNATITENLDSDTVSETSQIASPDSLSVTDETVKDSNDSLEKMGDLKKRKKAKIDSTNLTVFGHKVRQIFLLF